MDQVIKEGDAPEDGQFGSEFVEWFLREGQEEQGGSDGHQDIEQGGWVFRDIEKRHDGKDGVLLVAPGVRIAVVVDGPDEDKASDKGEAEAEEDLPAAAGVDIGCVQTAQVVAEGDEADPGEDRVTDDEGKVRVAEGVELMEKGPADGGETVAGDMDAIEQVV